MREGMAEMSITKEEQQRLFEEYETPPHIRAHCDEVARVSVLIAQALNEKGYHLSVEMLRGAASVHDVVRLREDHDFEAARILRERAHEEEAELVRQHMTYFPFRTVEAFREQDVLCLADRLVREDAYVGLECRMRYLMEKPGETPARTARIMEAKAQTQEVIAALEAVIGQTLDALCAKKKDEVRG